MKLKFLFFAIAVQIFITLFALIQSQIILHFGDDIKLKVEPIDPRDILRGDYVALNYTMPRPNELDEKCQNKYNFKAFAILQADEDGFYNISHIKCDKNFDNKIYLKGFVKNPYFERETLESARLVSDFGIERFFTTSKNAKQIEHNINNDKETFLNLKILNGKAIIESLQSNGEIYDD